MINKKLLQAFSLIELLITLIIISLLVAAFTPIITKKLKASDVTIGNFKQSSSKGSKEVLVSEADWIVPDRVTEIMVYMIAGGGSGASSSTIERYLYADIPALTNATSSILEAGTYDFTGVPTPNEYKAPVLPNQCKNAESIWIVDSTNVSVASEGKIPKFSPKTNVTIAKATACGAGGGGSYSATYMDTAPGGAGGYIADKTINLTNIANNITIIVGSGGQPGNRIGSQNKDMQPHITPGGAGGTGLSNGIAGTNGTLSTQYSCDVAAGSGGGGSTGIIGTSLEVPGGGGGGGNGVSGVNGCSTYGGNGGNGGGPNCGLGGSGSYCTNTYVCTLGKGATGYIAGSNGYFQTNKTEPRAGGGGGGIGSNAANKIFNTLTNCSGSSKGKGKPGAIQITYSTDIVKNGLSCKYYGSAQGAGGGGAGQVWIGTIKVVPGQKLSFIIGKGGIRQEEKAKDGFTGGDTSILVNGVEIAKVKGGKGGNFADGKGGLSESLLQENLSDRAVFLNWLGISEEAGQNGFDGTNDGTGGMGGSTYSIFNSCLFGGAGGSKGKNGFDANEASYGAGGGGGGSDNNFWGYGGKGADGYVYLEWKESI